MSAAPDGVCPKCGGALEVRRHGSTQGVYCRNCDWSVVTTHLPDFLDDPKTYVVRVTAADFRDERHLSTVSRLAGVNLLQARRMIEGGGDIHFTGLAKEVIGIRDSLTSAGVAFRIEPSFPW